MLFYIILSFTISSNLVADFWNEVLVMKYDLFSIAIYMHNVIVFFKAYFNDKKKTKFSFVFFFHSKSSTQENINPVNKISIEYLLRLYLF